MTVARETFMDCWPGPQAPRCPAALGFGDLPWLHVCSRSSGPCSCCSGALQSRILRHGLSTSLCPVGMEEWRVIVPFLKELQSNREGRKSKSYKGLESRSEVFEGSMLWEQIHLGARGSAPGAEVFEPEL